MTPAPATWRKSSYSVNTQNCVELADTECAIHVRDSKLPVSGALRFTPPEMAQLIAAAKTGDLDPLVT